MTSNVVNISEIRRARSADRESGHAAVLTTQLVFHFEGLSVIYFVFVSDFLRSDDFLNFCNATIPDVIFDMRVAPRLDFVRSTRGLAFELFDNLGIEYRDVLGRVGLTSYDVPTSEFEKIVANVDLLREVHDTERPMLALFDDANFSRRCSTALSGLYEVLMLNTDAVHRSVTEGSRLRM